jgi:hypothetical protein
LGSLNHDPAACLDSKRLSPSEAKSVLARIAQINGPPDSDNAREIIASKLDQLAARNAEIRANGEPDL